MPKRQAATVGLSQRDLDNLGLAFDLDPGEVQDSVRVISEWEWTEEELRAWLCQRYRWSAHVAANYLGALCLAVLRCSRVPELLPASEPHDRAS